MIGRISGILLEKDEQLALIDVQGVAYEVEVPASTFFLLPDSGTSVTLHTHFIVREDAQLLYGFLEDRERSLFRTLIRINGVGPKLALSMLSGMSVEDFVYCVQRDDVNALVKLPGIGKKTAERILIEVRDKLDSWTGSAVAGSTQEAVTGKLPATNKDAMLEAENALIALGFRPQDASRAVITAAQALEEDGAKIDSEALVKDALKNMN